MSKWAIQESSLDSKQGLQTLWPWLVPLSPLELPVIIRGLPAAHPSGDSAYRPQEQGCFRFRAQGSPSPSSHPPSFFPSFSPSLSPFSLLSAPWLSSASSLVVALMTLPGLPGYHGREAVSVRFRAALFPLVPAGTEPTALMSILRLWKP